MASRPTDSQTLAAERAAMETVLEAQRAAFRKERPASAEIRYDRLDRAQRLLIEHRGELTRAMAEDFSARPEVMSAFTDILSSVKALVFAKRHLKKWMRPERRRLEFPLGLLGARAWVEYQPKGVVGLISPWNFPVNLTFGPLAGILAAGNRVMVKPSEITPATAATMERLIGHYFASEEISVICGGPETGRVFASLPFDHLMFTGSTAVGREVMRAAADNLVPVTLELGGKSPVILADSADPEEASERILAGKMMNAGQICLAPDYLLVPRSRMPAVLDSLSSAARRLYPSIRGNPDATAIVNERHAERLAALVADARERGAEVTVVDPDAPDTADARPGRLMPLHLITGVSAGMRVMEEEIFGPLLPIVPYDGIEDAIAFVNDRPSPLALYYFGSDRRERRRVLDRTASGGVTLGDVLWHVGQETLPFGGIGPSGIGVYHGHDGFRAFSHARAIYRQARVNPAKLIGLVPPYSGKLRKLLAMQLKAK